MNIKDKLGKEILYFDGGMGTLLQQRGLTTSEIPEMWNITHSDVIEDIHFQYMKSGSNFITANTFGANRFKFFGQDGITVDTIVGAAMDNAKNAREKFGGNCWIALDIGPCGKLLKPFGTLDFEEAVDVFAETVRAGVKYGADLIIIETMNDLYETKAAVLAAKENSDLPVFVTNAYDLSGKLMTGASPEAVCATLEGLRVDAIGMNCSYGPRDMLPIVQRLVKCSSLPIIVSPNAGLPTSVNGKTVYNVGSGEFAEIMKEIAETGAHVLGGCCGTTPEYISAVKKITADFRPVPVSKKDITCVSSYTNAVYFGEKPILIGERINPTGKKLFKEALRNGDTDYILNVGIKQEDAGADILDVNVGLPEIDEAEVLESTVTNLQSVTALPLQIDTTDSDALGRAMRLYNGKPMVNSVNGTKESMDAVFPLVKKYGGLVVALTLDEKGIPKSAQERVKIAERIISEAEKYSIGKNDIIVDPLAMTISADNKSALCTLEAVERLTSLGINTSLGVSNISFGLPNREYINSSFFAMALTKGLSAAIMNPHSLEMMKVYKSFVALSGMDENCMDYIEFSQNVTTVSSIKESANSAKDSSDDKNLKFAIVKGLKEKSYELAKECLKTVKPLDLINDQIVPALDIVGKGFEDKTVFLPQLLISAESAKAAFDAVKEKIAQSGGSGSDKCCFVIATVQGDIHDIGKNIVKVLLENYGFNVIDLGRDVAPETVLEAVEKHNAPIVGLSALMTTTVPAMEETVRLIKKHFPNVKTVVGGAVLTEEYASMIGADKYAADAMETVRYAEKINAEISK